MNYVDILGALLVLLMHLVDVAQCDCKFPNHKGSDKDLQRRIQPLVGKT